APAAKLRLYGADLEFGTAAAVNPDPLVIIAPSAILNALGLALLVDHPDAAAGVHCAMVAAHVVRRTSHAQVLTLRHGRGAENRSAWSRKNRPDHENESTTGEQELPRDRAERILHGVRLPFDDLAGKNSISIRFAGRNLRIGR